MADASADRARAPAAHRRHATEGTRPKARNHALVAAERDGSPDRRQSLACSHTPTTAARRLGCSGATVTKLLAALERKGCLTRFRHANDARRTWLVLTIDGGDDRKRAEEQLAADADDFFAPLDDAEKDMLLGVLTKVRIPC